MKFTPANADANVAYVSFVEHADHEKFNVVKKMLRLSSLIEAYEGPEIHFDFDKDGRLVGIEILE